MQPTPQTHSKKHWTTHLQNSKTKWKLSTAVLGLLSIGGGVAANFLWLNPNSSFGGSAKDATSSQTVTGDPIQYRYGVVQLEVTANNGKIEKIKEIHADTTAGWESAIPELNKAAMEAQSADFGNLSGATFIAEAYKEALASALSKLQ